MWTFENARDMCALLDNKLRPLGWFVGLTGSLLTKGESAKDADIILYRGGVTQACTMAVLKKTLAKLGFENRTTPEFYARQAARDVKHVEIFDWFGDRVDIFFLS